ncbi:MAG TPA: HEAT repeat domain-containing protein [Mycobacteriales bacterium]|jgi:hypothetical protein|nr:HEAT repeat domain-containing protein [Mycobacteriales bacterium]
MPSRWGQTPRSSVAALCAARGRDQVVAGCLDLLGGAEVDSALILGLGGPPARWAVNPDEKPGPDYWLRVWALRGLLYAWDDQAEPSVLHALTDEAWRVREMAIKVVARHHLDNALPVVAELRQDGVARVRDAAHRAVRSLTVADD